MRQQATGERIKDMHATKLVSSMSGALDEITLITGLKVDGTYTKEFLKIFNKFILSHYHMLTTAEVVLAFTMNAANELDEKTDFYGSNLTIEHVGKVLFRYMQKRQNLAKKISEQRQEALAAPEPTKDEIDMQDKTFANEYYRKYLDKDFSSVSLSYAHMIYDVLDRFDLLQYSVKQKKEYYAKAQKARERELSAPSVDFQERKSNTKLMESYVDGILPSSEIELIKQYAKRLALFDRFDIWKAEGKKIIID